jgi:hypothetical protein
MISLIPVDILCTISLIISSISYYKIKNKSRLDTVSIIGIIFLLLLYFAVRFHIVWFLILILIPGIPPL